MSKINIETSILLSTQEFKIVGEVEYSKFGDGMCVEGHPIKYGIEVSDEEGNIYVFGSQCIAKPFILKYWELEFEMLDNPDVMQAGRYLWVIARDGLREHISEIPHPKDLDWDFKELKEQLKVIVANAKKIKRVELKKLMRQEKMKAKIEQFKTTHNKQCELIDELIRKMKRLKENNMFGILNGFYKEFVVSIVGQHRQLKVLSPKQKAIIVRILQLKESFNDVEKQNDELYGKITKAVEMAEILGNWDREFIFSIQSQFYTKGTLSEKQINKLDEILDKNEQFKEYIGKKMTSWITEQKIGLSGVHGIVKSVKAKAKSGMAILCTFEVEGNLYENWVPISHIK